MYVNKQDPNIDAMTIDDNFDCCEYNFDSVDQEGGLVKVDVIENNGMSNVVQNTNHKIVSKTKHIENKSKLNINQKKLIK